MHFLTTSLQLEVHILLSHGVATAWCKPHEFLSSFMNCSEHPLHKVTLGKTYFPCDDFLRIFIIQVVWMSNINERMIVYFLAIQKKTQQLSETVRMLGLNSTTICLWALNKSSDIHWHKVVFTWFLRPLQSYCVLKDHKEIPFSHLQWVVIFQYNSYPTGCCFLDTFTLRK